MAILGKKYLYMMAVIPMLCVGCVTTTQAVKTPEEGIPVSIHTQPYRVAILDRIVLWDKNGQSSSKQVRDDGCIILDSENKDKFLALDKTPEEIDKELHKRISNLDKVVVEEFRGNRVSVVGEVVRQTYTDLTESPMRVLDAIAAANGFTPMADTHHIKLMRQNAGQVKVYELDLGAVMDGRLVHHNMLLKPGDTIIVSRNFL